MVYAEVREGMLYIYRQAPGPGRHARGDGGKAMLLLSGGIDSPVAGYLMAKRGIALNAVHYHSFPFTSERAKQKVIDLRDIMQSYCGSIPLFVAPFTKYRKRYTKDARTAL